MAKAKQLPSGTWRVQARVTMNGQSLVRSFSAPTAKEAEAQAEAWQKRCKIIGSDYTQMTVKEAILNYIEVNTHRLSPSTVAGYSAIVRNNMTDIINKPLYNLTCPMIQQSISKSLETLEPKSIKNIYGLLETVLRVYYPDFIWAVKLPRVKQKMKPHYSHEYIKSVFTALKGSDFEAECYLGMLSMRASEIAGTKWEDIDFKLKTLHVCRAKLKNKDSEFVVVNNTKTEKSDRIIYLPDYVCNLLRERKAKSKSEYVSTVNPNRYWQKLNAILKKNNIEALGFHKLRHIYSSLTSDLGIDSQIRMENGGWSNEYIMNGTYRHSLSEAQVEANFKMNAYVNQMVENHTKNHTKTRQRLKLVRYGLYS